MKRISRGTPYVLTTGDVENVLGSMTPRMEESIAALLDMPVDEWRKQTKAKRAKQLVDFQNQGAAAAAFAAAAKAHTDLEEAAFAVTQRTEAESIIGELEALKAMVADLTHSHHTKGA